MADFDNFVNSTTSSDLLEVEKLSERVVIVLHPGEDSLPREGVAYEIQNVVPPEQRRVATFYREKPGKRAEHSPSFELNWERDTRFFMLSRRIINYAAEIKRCT